MKTYGDVDSSNVLPTFSPQRKPGAYLPDDVKLDSELDFFFQLFFADEITLIHMVGVG